MRKVIRLTGVRRSDDNEPPMNLFQAELAMMRAQLAAVETLVRDDAGRAELVRLHRANRIDSETLRSLELDLDLEELGAESAKA